MPTDDPHTVQVPHTVEHFEVADARGEFRPLPIRDSHSILRARLAYAMLYTPRHLERQ
jgi:hypothetical protein